MLKLNLPITYKHLNTDRKVRLLRHILKVQGKELKRLNYPETGKELGVDRAQVARDVRELEKLGLLMIKNGELQIVADILIEE